MERARDVVPHARSADPRGVAPEGMGVHVAMAVPGGVRLLGGIGVDGGASGFRAHEIVVVESARGPALALGTRRAEESAAPVAGFAPLPLERQRAEALAGNPVLSGAERELERRWIEAAARAIARVAAGMARGPLRVGVCAPGLKTADGRGVAVALQGPRSPGFAAGLERALADAGLVLARPLGALASDGLACAFGERLAEDGRLRDVEHAYYVGPGSGVAEALLVGGEALALDAAGLPKAWELAAEDGASFEAHLSVARLNAEFAARADAGSRSTASARSASAGRPSGTAAHEEPAPRLPEQAAAAGDPRARRMLAGRAERLAELAAARLLAWHASRGSVLERVVVGQRLGAWLLDPRLEACCAAPARAALAARLAERAPPALRDAWLVRGALAPGRFVGSDLRAAPALGAFALELARP